MKGPKIAVNPPGVNSRSWMDRWNVLSPVSISLPTFTEAEGIYLKDIDGNVYMNFVDLTLNVGHRNPRIIEAVKSQLDRTGVGRIRGANIPRVELMEKIMQIVPSGLRNGKFQFCNTGSDAAGFSMKLVRSYTGKSLLISYLGGHYGWSIGALSLTSDSSKERRFCLPLIPGVIHVPYPYCYRCNFGQEYPDCGLLCLEHLNYILDTVAHPDETAAIFVEPIQQVGGIVSPPDGYLAGLRRLCDEKGILFVDDEVAVGFGRTGKMFAVDHWGVIPDVMFLGKAFANGLSMAGIIARREIMEKEAENAVVRAGSFEGNPISCVAALATIEEILQKRLVENSAKVGDYMLKRLREISQEHELVGEVRGKGLLIGVELIKDNKSKKPAVEETEKTVMEALKRGLIATRIGIYRHIIRLTPPLILSKEESDKATEIIDDALREVGKNS